MAIAGGLSSQFGMVDEVTYGTAVTVTRFLEYNSESIKQSIERVESAGLRPNQRVTRSTHRQNGRVAAEGDVEFEVHNKGFGLILKHMLGTMATSNPAVGPSPTVYEHFATVGSLDDNSFTCQIGKTGTDGTTQPFTYAGCKIPDWELSCEVDGTLMLKATVDAASEVTNVALASASYATDTTPLIWTGGQITIAGSAYDATNFSLQANSGLKTDRYFMSATTPTQKRTPLEGEARREYTGSIDSEFLDLTAYNRFVSGATAAVTAFFTGGIAEDAYTYALEVTLPAVQFDGETPSVGGADGPLEQALPFKVLDTAAADGPVQIKYRTTDLTP